MVVGQLGIIGFFGVLVPGLYLLASFSVSAVVVFLEFGNGTFSVLVSDVKSGILTLSTGFLLLSYLLGVLMRLVGPNRIDAMSCMYFRWVRRDPVN